ncbi:ABC transporter permease [Mesorhizobium sp. YR577]|uniref:ABC transporter permease n=1 Tax=Mesorhizobium sp. YR577 TaxID=1884373 RepID=UPI0008EB9E4B|nr:ABC transporter permease [Mesorhizobium sp. YR577]SFU19125.1 mannopine transport system permease protein [Mesorhizobium sp. YR577]
MSELVSHMSDGWYARFRQAFVQQSFRDLSPVLSLCLLMPLLAVLTAGFLYPIGYLAKLSLFSPELDFSPYMRVFEQPLYMAVMARTFRVALAVTAASLLLGFPVAFAMARLKGNLALVAAASVFIALWSPVLVRSYAWIVLLQRNGVINRFITDAGIVSEALKLIYNEVAVIVAMTHVLMPFMILPIFAALRSIPKEYALAARNLGATATSAFVFVTLPLSLPGVFAGCVMCFILALGFYITPALIGGPGTLMMATLIGQQATALLDWPFAAALSTVLLCLTLFFVLIFRKMLSFNRGFHGVR